MTRLPTALRRHAKLSVAALAAFAGAGVYALTAGAATPIPVPEPLVMVTTKSGGFTRTTPVPIGGVPIPIDVTGPSITGLLEPDIDVSVGLVAVDELPGKPIVPNVVVRRNVLALALGRPAPPLDLDARVVLRDLNDGLKPFVEVHYGFSTPPGARIPPVISAKLVGPVQGGFIDPLQAKIESPGYSGPLDIKLTATTKELDAKFDLAFDALPESIFVTHAPREDGVDLVYEHNAPVADVHLDADVSLKDRTTNEVLRVGAEVERLPQRIALSNTNKADHTKVTFTSSSALAKPDLHATYRDLDGDGKVVTDATVDVAGLPFGMEGTIDSVGAGKDRTFDKIDFRVLDGDEIGAVDFLARNFTGPAGNVPAPLLGPEQFVAAGTRRQADGSVRYRAAGRIQGIRSATVERTGDENDGIDARVDVGDGIRPLRAVLDLDDRGPGAPDDAKRVKVDTSITPLPRNIHAVFKPSPGPTRPMELEYESASSTDIDVDAVIAEGAADGCGQARVLCAKARIDKVPSYLKALLPGPKGRDFSLSHTGGETQRPDVRAKLDTTDPEAKRTWADVAILRVPNEVTGRLDTREGKLHAAEFHGCEWDFIQTECDTPQQALGRVTFTARDRPERGDLPPRADTAATFVSFIKRDSRFEASGAVDEVRHVVFRQRDGEPKTLGALVDLGSKKPFDAVVDTIETPDAETGEVETKVRVHVAKLPDRFSACVRGGSEDPQPGGLTEDDLLDPCEDDELQADDDEPDLTPLTAIYDASSSTDVTANVKITKADLKDAGRLATTKVRTAILPLPKRLRVDAITPIADKTPTRKLQLLYGASQRVPRVEFGFESRRAADICEDPRPGRKALCVEGTLLSLPDTLRASYDPDETKGDIRFEATPPADGQPKLSIDPLRLTSVSPEVKDQPLVLDARVLGITPTLVGKFVSQNTPQDPPGEKSPTQLLFDACPGDDPCAGLEKIEFTATNALVGDPLPAAPPPDPDTTQDFTYVQRGLDFRAKGSISKLKEIGLNRRLDDGTPRSTTKVRAAFGDGTDKEKLRAFIDRQTLTDPELNTGREDQRVHAVISDAPKAINLCFRDKVNPDEVLPQNAPGAGFCEKAPFDKLAVQGALDEAAGGAKPDIDLREIRLSKGGGTDFLKGTVFIRDLAQRIDVLAGKGEKTDVLVEGHDLDDEPGDAPKNVAGRVTFDLRNYDGPDDPTSAFPFRSLNGTQDPSQDIRVDEGSEENVVKVAKDDELLLLQGSIPGIKRIALRPGACEAGPRFPAATDYPDATKAPDYTCVQLIAAQGHDLGLAIRTKDNEGEILSLDEGYLKSVPAGEGGIVATLASSPKAAQLGEPCGDPVDGTAAAGCRPPLLSVRAPKSDGQKSELQARLAVGRLQQVEAAREVAPIDEFSSRLDYEQPVRNYARPGARVKLVSSKTGTAVRAGLNIALPNFLDVEQPLTYTCTRVVEHINEKISPDDGRCQAGPQIGAKYNRGYSASDTHLRVIGANDAPLGTDLKTALGRVAVLVHDQDDGKQTVITGVHDATGPNGEAPDDPVASPPETAPPTGDHDLGVQVPGYLDAYIRSRGAYESPGEDDPQSTYFQVDGKTNAPLSLALRDVQSEALDGTVQTGRTRSGKDVAAMQIALRNAPGLPGGSNDLSKPTFRVRAELRGKHKKPDEGPYACKGFNPGGGRTAGFGANFCLYVPGDHIEKWLDVGMNMAPNADAPARTVDVVMDTRDYTQVDMKAFEDVDGQGGDEGKGDPAAFTPQAGLRLQPFPIGLEVGLGLGIVGGNTKLLLDGDLILKLTGHGNRRLRLSQNKGALRLLAEGGPAKAATIRTDNISKAIVQVRAEALFGLISENIVDVETGPYDQRVQFKPCAFPNLGVVFGDNDLFEVPPNDSTKTAIVLPPGDIPAEAAAAKVLGAASELLAPIWCMLSTDDDDLVDHEHPAPAYDDPGHPITGIFIKDPPVDDAPEPGPQPPADLTIGPGEPDGADQTFCNRLGAKTLRVKSGGVLRVGYEGLEVVETIDADGAGPLEPEKVKTLCTGTLAISSDRVVVEAGGRIVGDAVRTTPGSGQPGSGLGGGAGHVNGGGASGLAGGPGGGSYGATSPVLEDAGSRGRDGSGGADGGAGGGTLSLQATETIQVDGTVSVNGGAGEASGAAGCGATGAGGGSAGHVELKATTVLVGAGGAVEARGGRGGNGANAGGGGGGGRVTVNTVAPRPASGLSAAAGGTGTAEGGCAAGGPGSAGDAALGTTINFAAGVTFDSAEEVAPTYVRNAIPVHLRAVRNLGGRLKVLVCRSSVGVSGGLGDPGIEPPAGGIGAILSGSSCRSEDFAGPTSGGSIYERDVELPVSDGYHGLFAIAARPPLVDPDADCLQAGDGCTYQEAVPSGDPVLPTVSTVKVGSDASGPNVSFAGENGTPGCLDGRKCLAQAGTMAVQASDGQGGAGLAEVRCAINGGDFELPCGPGASVSVDFGTGDGIQDISIRATDRIGNMTTIPGPRWVVDRKPGVTPTVTVTPQGPQVNGWRKQKPLVTVSATDDGAGFDPQPITLFTDASAHTCGTVSGDELSATCSSAQTAPFVPGDGIHTFQAQATDKLGNVSLKSDPKTMKVDASPPKMAMFLGPRTPDGNNDYYVTKPFVAFRAVDGVGESGVDIAHSSGVSKIEFHVDAGPAQVWNPEDPNVLPDGIHTVCFRATDLAGNTSPTACRIGIKVDSVAPTVSDPISPATPDGTDGWYLGTPTVDGAGDDLGSSGLDRVELQVDGGLWTTAAPTQISEGEHTVRTRAFDKAGNPSPILERTVRVDKSDPAARLGSQPPSPNDQGWFRRQPSNSVSATDGRDGSGADGATWRMDGGSPVSYLGKFTTPDGVHTVGARGRDFAGRTGAEATVVQRVDTVAPAATPLGTPRAIIVQFLGLPSSTTLSFTAGDALSPRVRATAIVYDELGRVARRLPVAGPHPGGYRDNGPASVTWNGRDAHNRGVLPGLYHFRVQVTDQAGNTVLSPESKPFLVGLGILPG